MPLHLDLSGVRLSFEPLSPGVYHARVDNVEERMSRASGLPTLAWTFVVDDEPFEGRKLFLNTSLQEQALWKLGQTLVALGWAEEEVVSEEGLDIDLEDLLDLDCRLVVTTREYQGTLTNQVERVLPPEVLEGLGTAEEMELL